MRAVRQKRRASLKSSAKRWGGGGENKKRAANASTSDDNRGYVSSTGATKSHRVEPYSQRLAQYVARGDVSMKPIGGIPITRCDTLVAKSHVEERLNTFESKHGDCEIHSNERAFDHAHMQSCAASSTSETTTNQDGGVKQVQETRYVKAKPPIKGKAGPSRKRAFCISTSKSTMLRQGPY